MNELQASEMLNYLNWIRALLIGISASVWFIAFIYLARRG